MPDEIDAAPGTTEGTDTSAGETEEERSEAGEREQGVRTEESRDLSSPRFTVREDDDEAR
jgi:hypothetical protein